jgi:hypothetical protein
MVYRKMTHADLYLHTKSEHHLAQKRAVLTTLIQWIKTLCDPDSLEKVIQHLRDTFQRNGYSKSEIRRALHPKLKPEPKNNKPAGTAVLPYQQAVSNKISRLLIKYNIKTVHMPIKKNRQLLRTAKDDLGLKIPGVYHIRCKCGKVYIGQTGRSIEARCKEHMRHIRLDQPEKSMVAEHSINARLQIDFSVSVLDRALGYMDCLVKEAIQIRLNQNNINRDNGFTLSRAWNPTTKLLSTHSLDPGKAVIEPAHQLVT